MSARDINCLTKLKKKEEKTSVMPKYGSNTCFFILKIFILVFNDFNCAFVYNSGLISIWKKSNKSFKSPSSTLLNLYNPSEYNYTSQSFKALFNMSTNKPSSQFLSGFIPL